MTVKHVHDEYIYLVFGSSVSIKLRPILCLDSIGAFVFSVVGSLLSFSPI